METTVESNHLDDLRNVIEIKFLFNYSYISPKNNIVIKQTVISLLLAYNI